MTVQADSLPYFFYFVRLIPRSFNLVKPVFNAVSTRKNALTAVKSSLCRYPVAAADRRVQLQRQLKEYSIGLAGRYHDARDEMHTAE